MVELITTIVAVVVVVVVESLVVEVIVEVEVELEMLAYSGRYVQLVRLEPNMDLQKLENVRT